LREHCSGWKAGTLGTFRPSKREIKKTNNIDRDEGKRNANMNLSTEVTTHVFIFPDSKRKTVHFER